MVLFWLLLPLLILFILKGNSKPKKLPPGPYPWPIVGNLLQVRGEPHVGLANMARTHGPLISLRLGAQLLVVATSPDAASQILRTHDRALSSRHLPHTTQIQNYAEFSLVWSSQCNDNWKALRKICRTELFSARMMEAQSHLIQQKVSELVGFLSSKQGEAVRIGEVVFATVFNLMGTLVFSRDIFDLADGKGSCELKAHIWRMMELAVAPNLADFFPLFGGLDVQGLRRESAACVKRVYDIWDVFIRERREKDGDDSKDDFLNVLLAAGFSDNHIKALLLDMFVAGTDTTTSAIEWTMAELTKAPEIMSKVRIELENVIGRERSKDESMVKESHLMDLNYLQACIKEMLRLHPPVPLLLPRRAVETCEVMGFTVPRDCQVMVNAWAIGRDPKTWPDPLTFLPDRFLKSDLDYKGNHFEFIPFGAGRRMCPGLPLATQAIQLILASLIHSFDWCLPQGLDPAQLNMDEKLSLTLGRKYPLILIPTKFTI